jgi:uncharacterized protein YbjT (DUF2867 family)
VKIVLFGATGMVGGGALIECLEDPSISAVVSVGRRPTGRSHPKLRELLLEDLFQLADLRSDLEGCDACFYCLGVSAVGMTEAAYRRVTLDLTMSVAGLLSETSPSIRFCFVSGQGADSTERGRTMWARVKGEAENRLISTLDAYVFRPGFILPLKGVRSRTRIYRLFYTLSRPLYPLLPRLFPGYVTTSENIGRAMISVAGQGSDRRILENPDIDRLASLGSG